MASRTLSKNGASGPVDPGIMCAQPGMTQDNRILGTVNERKGLLLLGLMDGKSQELSGLCYPARFQRSAIQCRNCLGMGGRSWVGTPRSLAKERSRKLPAAPESIMAWTRCWWPSKDIVAGTALVGGALIFPITVLLLLGGDNHFPRAGPINASLFHPLPAAMVRNSMAKSAALWEEKRPIQEMYEISVLRQAKKIVADDTHILHVHFNMLPSGRRLRILICQSNRYKNDFVPTAVKLLSREERK